MTLSIQNVTKTAKEEYCRNKRHIKYFNKYRSTNFLQRKQTGGKLSPGIASRNFTHSH